MPQKRHHQNSNKSLQRTLEAEILLPLTRKSTLKIPLSKRKNILCKPKIPQTGKTLRQCRKQSMTLLSKIRIAQSHTINNKMKMSVSLDQLTIIIKIPTSTQAPSGVLQNGDIIQRKTFYSNLNTLTESNRTKFPHPGPTKGTLTPRKTIRTVKLARNATKSHIPKNNMENKPIRRLKCLRDRKSLYQRPPFLSNFNFPKALRTRYLENESSYSLANSISNSFSSALI